jgi:hypothetical protein
MPNANRRPTGLIVLMLCAALASACDDEPSYACLAVSYPAFVLEIRDSLTNEGRAVESVATVVDGAFSDTLPLTGGDGNDAWREGPTERGGVYDLTVTASGYQTWAMQNVTVHSGRCGVATVRLDVRLQQD